MHHAVRTAACQSTLGDFEQRNKGAQVLLLFGCGLTNSTWAKPPYFKNTIQLTLSPHQQRKAHIQEHTEKRKLLRSYHQLNKHIQTYTPLSDSKQPDTEQRKKKVKDSPYHCSRQYVKTGECKICDSVAATCPPCTSH